MSNSKLENNLHVQFAEIESKYTSSLINDKKDPDASINLKFDELKKKDEHDIGKTFRSKNKSFTFCFNNCICSY